MTVFSVPVNVIIISKFCIGTLKMFNL